MELNILPNNLPYSMNSAPAVAIAILIVPIIDTLRVFFSAWRRGNRHSRPIKTIHHRMLSLGYSHLRISLTIGFVNIGFVILAYSLRNIGMLK